MTGAITAALHDLITLAMLRATEEDLVRIKREVAAARTEHDALLDAVKAGDALADSVERCEDDTLELLAAYRAARAKVQP